MSRFYRIQAGLFRKYLFSLDHKVIGLQYALTSLIFLLIGFLLAILFRWQVAYPGQPVPVIGNWFGPLNAADWFFLAGFHLNLHRRQIERIQAALIVPPSPPPAT